LGGKRFVILPEKEYRALKNGNARARSRGSGPKSRKTPDAPLARLTRQVRGDIAWARRLRKDPAEKPVAYDVVRKFGRCLRILVHPVASSSWDKTTFTASASGIGASCTRFRMKNELLLS
jgi:hypothetical protein